MERSEEMTVAGEVAERAFLVRLGRGRQESERSVHVRGLRLHRQERAPIQATRRARGAPRLIFASSSRGSHVGPGRAPGVVEAAFQTTHPTSA